MEEQFYVPDTEDDLVYAPSRYIEGNSPNAIYYPSKRLMLKMMRSCIDPKKKYKSHLSLNKTPKSNLSLS